MSLRKQSAKAARRPDGPEDSVPAGRASSTSPWLPPPAIPITGTLDQFYARRRLIYIAVTLSGFLYYPTYKAWALVSPHFLADLALDKSAVGKLSSTLALSYAVSKFAVAPLADWMNLRLMSCLGLVLVALCGLGFASATSLNMMLLAWVGNGLFSGAQWPPVSKLLIYWLAPNERGTWWGIASTARPASGVVLALALPLLAESYGWRVAVAVPALLGLVGAVMLYVLVRDTPQELGLPTPFPSPAAPAKPAEASVAATGSDRSPLIEVFSYPSIWLLNAACALNIAAKSSVNDWLVLWLVEARGYDRGAAAGLTSYLEIGFSAGSLLSGWVSDRYLHGSRNAVNLYGQLVASLAITMLFFGPTVAPALTLPVLIFVFGACINTPGTLIGMVASENVPPRLAATACGVVGGFGYLGAAAVGLGLGSVTQSAGWNTGLALLAGIAILCNAALLPLWWNEQRKR